VSGVPTLLSPSPAAIRTLAGLLAGALAAAAGAEPFTPADVCFVRPEARPAGAASSVVPAAAESRLGIRRKTGQLFDVELSVVGGDGALCTIAGIARLRPGDVLVLPVRQEAARTAKPSQSPCLVSLRNLGSAIEVGTTESACQAQALCAGQVQLNGQRFELATRLPAGVGNACFAVAPK
jgi:hypothetical protein